MKILILSIMGVLNSGTPLHSIPLDSAFQNVKTSKAEVFHFPEDLNSTEAADLLFKRILPDGSLCDLPPDQLFNVYIAPEPEGFYLLSGDGKKGKELLNVKQPIKAVLDAEEGRLNCRAEIIETNARDSTYDTILTAPSKELKAYMLWRTGINKLKLLRFKEARQTFFEQINLDPAYKKYAYYNIACSYALEGDTAHAIKYLLFAFSNGYDQYKYALCEDEDFSSIRQLPEFIAAVTVKLRKQRESFLKEALNNHKQRGEKYFKVAETFLEYCSADSFYFWLEKSLQNNFHPGFARFLSEEFETVSKDTKLDSLLVRYFSKSDSFWFPISEIELKPLLAKRMKCDHVPEKISSCTNLLELHFTNKLSGLPDELSELKNLRNLNLWECGLDSFPKVITAIPSLNILDVHGGYFKALPDGTGNLAELHTLSLQNNLIVSLPGSMRHMKKLASLFLSENRIAAFPQVINELKQLKHLDLSDNLIRSIPASVILPENLEFLNLSGNFITDISREIGRLRKLWRLDLSFNGLSKLPPEICNLESLEFLDLSFNQLDSLPHSLWQLKKLRTLIVFGNKLTENEIRRIRRFLPECRVIGEEQQNSFRISEYAAGVFYSDSDLGMTFIYPAGYELLNKTTGNSEKDYSIVLKKDGKGIRRDSSGTIYGWKSILEISILKKSLEGFEKKYENIKDSDTSGKNLVYWLLGSSKKSGIKFNISAINANGWYGLFGKSDSTIFSEKYLDDVYYPDDEQDYYSDEDEYGNYEEDYGSSAEYFNAYAVKRFDDGTQVLVSFSDDFNNDHSILKQILLSLQYSKTY